MRGKRARRVRRQGVKEGEEWRCEMRGKRKWGKGMGHEWSGV